MEAMTNQAIPDLNTTLKVLSNGSATLVTDLHGGAITDFHFDNHQVNPLSFRFSREQMPENNKNGAVYQGHFLCLGRWGEPSQGEKLAGIPNHGQFANMLWQQTDGSPTHLQMHATSKLEGLLIERSIELDAHEPVFAVHETVTNIQPLGRLYQAVQHPTIAAPFLDKDVIVDCNAAGGFEFSFNDLTDIRFGEWPYIITKTGSKDISTCKDPLRSVFSFVVDPRSGHGWITAFSPSHNLLIGYLWKREDYPWINHWIHWEENKILYRGLEFGTTGIHKPFEELLNKKLTEVLGEKTFSYIDAGTSHSRKYLSFLSKTGENFQGVEAVICKENRLTIREKNSGKQVSLPFSINY